MSLINSTIKSFKSTALHDGKFVPVSEANLKGKWSVVFFYPADFTFVCPTELGDLADNYDTFKSLGVEIYSVSTDTHFAHKAWHDSSGTISKNTLPDAGRTDRCTCTQFRRDGRRERVREALIYSPKAFP